MWVCKCIHFQLEAISEMNPVDLRKQLRVEFKGEEGLDEGGLQKELFQLLIEKLLDPMYGELRGTQMWQFAGTYHYPT